MTSSQRQWLPNPHNTHAVAIKRMEGKKKAQTSHPWPHATNTVTSLSLIFETEGRFPFQLQETQEQRHGP